MAAKNNTEHHGKASSFADPVDVAAFRRCKAKGKSDQDCFKAGDNGVGFWGDDCTVDEPLCALPPEDLIERWGSVNAGHNKQVLVSANGKQVVCKVRDRMPHKAHITNGAIIDLNPGACFHLGLTPPVMEPASWRWVS